MKRIGFLCVLFFSFPLLAFASGSGACSYHGGVDCEAGPNWDGTAQCYDGYSSSVQYSAIDECNPYAGFVALSDQSSCDYFIVKEASGDYALLQHWQGYSPQKGDLVYGDIDGYGFKYAYFTNAMSQDYIYTEDYWLTPYEAVKEYLDYCQYE